MNYRHGDGLRASNFTRKTKTAMAKNKLAGEWISPENLWGKPLPPALKKPTSVTAEVDDAEDDEDEDEDEDKDDEDDTEDEDGIEYDEAADFNVEVSDEPETVSTVVDAATPMKKVENSMPAVMVEKKSGADHCRAEIARRAATGESLRGVDIVAALAKHKIVINPAQVSQLLKKAKEGGLICTLTDKSRVAAKAKPTAKPAARPAARPAAKPALEEVAEAPRGPRHSLPKRKISAPGAMPMAQLKAASAFVAACDGCYDTAQSILADHKQVRSLMGR